MKFSCIQDTSVVRWTFNCWSFVQENWDLMLWYWLHTDYAVRHQVWLIFWQEVGLSNERCTLKMWESALVVWCVKLITNGIPVVDCIDMHWQLIVAERGVFFWCRCIPYSDSGISCWIQMELEIETLLYDLVCSWVEIIQLDILFTVAPMVNCWKGVVVKMV